MARRRITSKSTRGRRRRSAASESQQVRSNRLTAMAVIGIMVILVGYRLLTGSDLLGMFGEAPATHVATATPRPVTGGGGDWWQVFFTDPQQVDTPDDLTGSVPRKLIDYIHRAQHSIHIAAYEFDLAPVAEALIAAHERGVEVQYVTDDEHGLEADEDEGPGLFAMLSRSGIEVRDDQRGALMHNKFWIFDAQTVWTGSTNITVNGSFRNNNNVIVMDSSELAAIYEREFAEMWAGEFGPTSPSTAGDQTVTIDGTTVEVLFSPEDDVVGRLIPLIEGAQGTIRFMAYAFTLDEVGAAVLARADAGVDVKGIFETRASETEFSELPLLYCAGLAVRQDGNPRSFHHKVFIIDEHVVITGSLNFSESAARSNDENTVIVANSDVAAQYLQEFERRWAEAIDPGAADMNCS